MFYRNLLALWNLLITDFSWKPAWVHSVCPWLGVSGKQGLRAAVRRAQTLAKNSGGFVAPRASSLLGVTEWCHVDHSQFWKQHLLASSVCNCFSSWIVIKACSWDALPLLGYEAEEHQLSATNPLNSLDKFHWQFLLFESVATSLKIFLCRQWKAPTGYGQTGLLGNVPVGSLPWGRVSGSGPYYSQWSVQLGSFCTYRYTCWETNQLTNWQNHRKVMAW